MGMTVVAQALEADELARLLEDPSTANELLECDEDDPGPSDGSLDLDKSWHGVHFLLTGTAWSVEDALGGAVLGGRDVGEDWGYGPPRLLEPQQVREVAGALGRVGDDEIRRRFDPEQMQRLEIYPGIWDEADVFDEYLLPNVRALRDFYTHAAARGAAVLICVQ